MTEHARSLNLNGVEREELPVDVLLVGAGPASLACAIHLSRLLKERGREDATLLVLEKAQDIGYHTLSGAVMDPRGMAELFPDWKERGCPVEAQVTFDCVDFLKKGGVFSDDFIDSYIELKMNEVYAFEHTPHPVEFKMYYSV